MNRWEAYQYRPIGAIYPILGRQGILHKQNAIVQQDPPLTGVAAFQQGTVGNFIGSSLEGSGFMRCVYTTRNTINATVTLLCDAEAGCCEKGCCPQDLFWMTGVFVLLAFVLFVFIVGSCIVICCYWRTKNEQRREAYEYSSYGSQVGMYPDGYSSYTNPVMSQRY